MMDWAYALNSSDMASRKQIALPAMTCISGPPCRPGKTLRLISLASSSCSESDPARGPRNVLCVVVVTKVATGTGLWCSPAATRPA